MPFPNRFTPGARYCVATWRGIDVPGEPGHLALGEEIPDGLLDNQTMFTLFIQCRIERVENIERVPSDEPEPERDDEEEEPAVKRGRPRKVA